MENGEVLISYQKMKDKKVHKISLKSKLEMNTKLIELWHNEENNKCKRSS